MQSKVMDLLLENIPDDLLVSVSLWFVLSEIYTSDQLSLYGNCLMSVNLSL